jgi:heptosyltransferase III
MQRSLHTVRDAGIRRAARFTRASSAADGNTILVIQPDHLGDILLSQPAVRHIRSRYPDHHLVAVVGPWSEAMTRRAWPVDEVVTVKFPGFRREPRSGSVLSPYLMLKEAAGRLRTLDAARAFVLRADDWWSAWLASMSTTGPIVSALDRRMDPFATVQVDLSPHGHATPRALAIAGAPNPQVEWSDATQLRVSPGPDARSGASEHLRNCGVGERYIAIHPGSGADVKLWPSDRWREIARRLTDHGYSVVVTGTNSEVEMAGHIVSGLKGAVSLAGRTDLDVLIALLGKAQLVAGPDSGPLHLAVACQTPTVHLFGPSDPARFGPWGPPGRHRVVTAGWTCGRCGDLSLSRARGCGCMLAITVNSVYESIREMIEQHDAH